MDDKFLYQLYEEPEQEFVAALRQKLTHSSEAALSTKRISLPRRPFTARRMAWAVATLIVTFATAMAVSPAVRAAVTDIIRTIIIRGTTVMVSDENPSVRGEAETYSFLWTPSSPDEIAANYPIFAKLPTWVPADFVLQEHAALYYGDFHQEAPDTALFEWKSDKGETIQLSVSMGSCLNGSSWDSGYPRSDCKRGTFITVGSESEPDIITINDQPALLFPGFLHLMDISGQVHPWNPARVKYDTLDPEALFLLWEADEQTFEIATKSTTISKDDLIRLAKSIP